MEKLYLDFHVIQTVPPSCVNRDDTGKPKTAIYGGVNRARVSSQSWKHAMREKFKEDYAQNENLGHRTKHIAKLIEEKIKEISPDIDDKEAKKLVEAVLKKLKFKSKSTDGNTVIEALFFISDEQIKAFAELSVQNETDEKKYKAVLNEKPSVDIAMFGRMAANDPDLNYDAAVQVAHSISTHAVENEYDYFTAVDDVDDNGAGHLGTMEFNSATLYRYATINVAELAKSLKADSAEAVKMFADAFIYSMPTGKQNSYANRTVPDFVYVTVRRNQPVNLCGAFEKPVYTNGGYTEPSVKTLEKYANDVYEYFTDKPQMSFVLGKYDFCGAQKAKSSELCEKLGECVSDYVNEVV